MPLKIVVDEQGVNCPRVFCDECGGVIATAKEGNFQWLKRDAAGQEPANPPIMFTHKRCSYAFEAARGRGAGAWWFSDELLVFPLYLARNLEIDHDEAAENARRSL